MLHIWFVISGFQLVGIIDLGTVNTISREKPAEIGAISPESSSAIFSHRDRASNPNYVLTIQICFSSNLMTGLTMYEHRDED